MIKKVGNVCDAEQKDIKKIEKNNSSFLNREGQISKGLEEIYEGNFKNDQFDGQGKKQKYLINRSIQICKRR